MATVRLQESKVKKIKSSIFLYEGVELAMPLKDAMTFCNYSDDISGFLRFAQKGTYSLSYLRNGISMNAEKSLVTKRCLLSIRDSKLRKRALNEKKRDALTAVIDIFEECEAELFQNRVKMTAKEIALNSKQQETPEEKLVDVISIDDMVSKIRQKLNTLPNGDYSYKVENWKPHYENTNKMLKNEDANYNVYNKYREYKETLQPGEWPKSMLDFLKDDYPHAIELMYYSVFGN